MPLEDWLARGWVTKRPANREEIRNLLAIADRDLHKSQTEGLGPDWKFAIAYNAALQCAAAALAASGYRAVREAHHYRVIQSLALTLPWTDADVGALDDFRRKRHMTEYERPEAVSEYEAEDMLRLSMRLRDDVQAWLAARHPELL